jgi:hypothetical protein
LQTFTVFAIAYTACYAIRVPHSIAGNGDVVGDGDGDGDDYRVGDGDGDGYTAYYTLRVLHSNAGKPVVTLL